MTRLHISVAFLVTLIGVAANSVSVDAQTAAAAAPSVTKSATLELSIAVPNPKVPLGQKPWVHLTVTNLGNQEISYPRERVYVEGPNGEPSTTLIERQMTNRLKRGDTLPVESGFRPPIAPREWPGNSFTAKYDLSYFYDFKEPGKYTVYIEVFDRLSENPKATSDTENWLRSPVATFELLPPTQ
jgi:hypothetical protein